MSTELHAKILAFASGAFALGDHQTCVRVELSYAPPGGYRADPLKTWLPETSPELFSTRGHIFVERLVSEILELAEGHADSYGQGRHRFQIRTHQHMGGRQTHAFAILPGFTNDDQALAVAGGGGPGELVPSATGLVGQLMRHLETRDRNAKEMLQSFLGAMSHHTQQMREENSDLRAQLAARDRERMEWLNTIEQARSTEHDRQIQAAQVTAKEERKSYATKKIVNLLPVVFSQWSRGQKDRDKAKKATGADGKPVDPTPQSPLAKAIAQLVDTLTDDQKETLGGLLSMEQQIAFSEVVAVVQDGDSALLPTMLHDLVSTFQPRQIAGFMSALDDKQRVLFVQAIGLAKSQAAPDPTPTAPADDTTGTTTNGVPQGEAS